MELKVIDFELNGNSILLYAGNKELKDWGGDDWDDTPYECNAGTVYDEYVEVIHEYAFNHKALILEPEDGECNSNWSKDDMKNRLVPMVAFMSAEEYTESSLGWCGSFSSLVSVENSHKIYMGDDFQEVIKELTNAGAVLVYGEEITK